MLWQRPHFLGDKALLCGEFDLEQRKIDKKPGCTIHESEIYTIKDNFEYVKYIIVSEFENLCTVIDFDISVYANYPPSFKKTHYKIMHN